MSHEREYPLCPHDQSILDEIGKISQPSIDENGKRIFIYKGTKLYFVPGGWLVSGRFNESHALYTEYNSCLQFAFYWLNSDSFIRKGKQLKPKASVDGTVKRFEKEFKTNLFRLKKDLESQKKDLEKKE